MREFVYERPGTVEEAVAAMRSGDARALAGGTDLVPQLREGRRGAGHIIDIKHIPDVTAIYVLPDGGVSIGGYAAFLDASDPSVILSCASSTRLPSFVHSW